MHKKTLVLNSAWYPINVIGWRDAMAHLFDPDFMVISSYEDEVIKSAHNEYKLPAVIVTKVAPAKVRTMKFSSGRLIIRDNRTCAYCGKQFKRSDLNIDHIIPRSQGGKTAWLNCITSCFPCNSKKRNRTPEEAGMPLLFLPSVPRYDHEYFLNWNGTVYEEWKPYLPEKKRRVMVEEVVPEIKYGRKPRKV